MDDIGRQVFCQMLNESLKQGDDIEDIRFICEGTHRRTIVISMNDQSPIISGRLSIDNVLNHIKRPYAEALKGFNGLVLRGDKATNKLDDPVPVSEIASRLDKLGTKTIGDFYAACGFEKFIVREEQQKTSYLELTFSNKHYGYNPIEVKK